MPKGVYNHKPLLEQHRKNISKAKKATGSGSNNPFYGKTHSDEQRKKWKTTRKGQKPWNTGKKMPREMVEKGIRIRELNYLKKLGIKNGNH